MAAVGRELLHGRSKGGLMRGQRVFTRRSKARLGKLHKENGWDTLRRVPSIFVPQRGKDAAAPLVPFLVNAVQKSDLPVFPCVSYTPCWKVQHSVPLLEVTSEQQHPTQTQPASHLQLLL